MAYEIYKSVRTKKEFYDTWETKTLSQLTAELKTYIYSKYLLKCKVFQRDSFKCQNIDCKNPYSQLTLHHVKFKKNGGEDKERNGVTVCKTCHKRYHRAKDTLTFPNESYLPPRIRGHTFKLAKSDKIDWKKIKSDMRALRKELMQQGVKPLIDWDLIAILLKWCFIPFDEDDD